MHSREQCWGPRGQRFHKRVKQRQSNTCWATDSQHGTSQQACLLFLMSVIYMKDPTSPNRNRVLDAAAWLTGFHISHVPATAPPSPLIPLPPWTTWWWLQDYSIKHIASLAAVKCNCSVFSLWYSWWYKLKTEGLS